MTWLFLLLLWQFFYECIGWTPTLGSLLYFHSFAREGTEEVANNKRFQYEFCVGSCVSSNIHSKCNLEITRHHGNYFLWRFSAAKVNIQSLITPSFFGSHNTDLITPSHFYYHPRCTAVLRNAQMDLKKSPLLCCYFYSCKSWLCAHMTDFYQHHAQIHYYLRHPFTVFHILHLSG